MDIGLHDIRAIPQSQMCTQPASMPHDGSAFGLVGRSAAIIALCSFVRRLAPSNATVLISGETGTGKELIAAMVHRMSRRANGPLVALNCAAIPEALFEGELFGYERGAFSGAISAHPGKLKLADGGTLLLDEIGELSPTGQAKVLRAIETGQAYRLGAHTPTRFDVRIIASTNRNLAAEMAIGQFRSDLYYRLAVAQLSLPPLRERPEDVGPIARHLLTLIAGAAGRPSVELDEGAVARLERHDWPGNARELRNMIEVALINCDGERISARHLPAFPLRQAPPTAAVHTERTQLMDALARTQGNKSLAAQALNCSRMTLYRRMSRLGLTDSFEGGL